MGFELVIVQPFSKTLTINRSTALTVLGLWYCDILCVCVCVCVCAQIHLEAKVEEEEEEFEHPLFERGGKDRNRDRDKPGEKLDVRRLELLLKQRVKSQKFCVSQLHVVLVF